jgi:hypothetical protein
MTDPTNPWVPRPPAEVLQEPPSRPASRPTGPTAPQRGLTAPDQVDQLPTATFQAAAPLWWVGTHGGAGESSLASLVPGWRASGHAWPSVPSDRERAKTVLVARSNVHGLLRAQSAATQWAAGLAPCADVVGLVVVADAPGRMPRPLRDLAQLVGGGVPHVWHVPWIEAWRLGEPVSLAGSPTPVQHLVSELRSQLGTV